MTGVRMRHRVTLVGAVVLALVVGACGDSDAPDSEEVS